MIFDLRTRGLLLRSIPIVLVFALSFGAFELGVGVSDRPSVETAGVLGKIYYAVGLFVLGGMDLGVPTGGPVWARAMLWVAYFLGPLITTSAVAEGLLRVVQPRWWRRWRMQNHLVVVGAGRLGGLCLHGARAAWDTQRLVVVDRSAALATVAEAERRYRAEFVQGDIQMLGTVDELHLDQARGVVLATDSDLVNLEAAWDLRERHPDLPMAVHVSDIALARSVDKLGKAGRVRVFNSHRIAAAHLYTNFLDAHFHSTGHRDVVVLAGFGRFGQTILEYLQTHASEELQRVLLLDRSARDQSRVFAEQVGFVDRCSTEALDGDIEDPGAWDAVAERLATLEGVPVFVLCVDSDTANLHAAVTLRRRFPDSPIYVRVFSGSRFVDDMAQQHRFEMLAVEELLRAALTARFAEVFSDP